MLSSFLTIANANVWRGDNCVLSDFSLELVLGESVAILGPNGAGKSTLVQLLKGGLRPEARVGTKHELFEQKNYAISDLRTRIGCVTAEDMTRMDSAELVMNLVLFSLRGADGVSYDMQFNEEERLRASEVLEKLRLVAYSSSRFGELSMGQKQRVLLACALVHRPEVLLFDEPTSGLDFGSAMIFAKIRGELVETGSTVILITHNPAEIPPQVSRCLLLKGGRVFADGGKEEVMTSANLTELYDTPLQVSFVNEWCQVNSR